MIHRYGTDESRGKLGWEDLERYIRDQGITAEIIRCKAETLTVSDAARELATTPDQIIKSLLFFIQDQPVMAIASGLARVDRRTLAGRFGVGRKRVLLADPDQVLRTTGYEVGAVPPFGFKQDLKTFIDPAVMAFPIVYCGGGGIDRLLGLSPGEIIRVTGAEVLDLQHHA
jgi:prolyl-tRNA editing enzyme YbaK/EbsC (Cys-tRNA(Pro) deacylase)